MERGRLKEPLKHLGFGGGGGLTDDFAYKWQNWFISAQPEVHALADLIWAYLELNYMQ